MRKHDLIEMLDTNAGWDDGCLTVFQDTATGKIYQIDSVEYDPGVDAVASTMFLKGTEV